MPLILAKNCASTQWQKTVNHVFLVDQTFVCSRISSVDTDGNELEKFINLIIILLREHLLIFPFPTPVENFDLENLYLKA